MAAVAAGPALRASEETVRQDWPRLAAYLAQAGMTLETEPEPRQFAGGLANLNYLIRIDDRETVLRRPPMGPLPPGAYDMGRESRILRRLHERFPLAPRALHLCLLGTWLRSHAVPDRHIGLLHNDFKLDNVLLDAHSLAPVAVLDWDQGTRGDVLFDLATLLSYWTEPRDPPSVRAMRQMPTEQPGFPRREAVAQAYATVSGTDLSDFRFHRVLAQLKTAVILLQLHLRYRSGETQHARYAEFGSIGQALLEQTHEIATNRMF
jgi:aminoglycoside phosphotransferase (APT) family kinase protein